MDGQRGHIHALAQIMHVDLFFHRPVAFVAVITTYRSEAPAKHGQPCLTVQLRKVQSNVRQVLTPP